MGTATFEDRVPPLWPGFFPRRSVLPGLQTTPFEEVLPDVPFAAPVFTISKLLRKAFLFDRSLYGDLCRSAYAATRKFFEAPACVAERNCRRPARRHNGHHAIPDGT